MERNLVDISLKKCDQGKKIVLRELPDTIFFAEITL